MISEEHPKALNPTPQMYHHKAFRAFRNPGQLGNDGDNHRTQNSRPDGQKGLSASLSAMQECPDFEHTPQAWVAAEA